MLRSRAPILLLALSCASAGRAQEAEQTEVSWRIVLRTGAFLNGQLLRQDALEVELVDREGNLVVVEREQVARVECLKGTVTAKVGDAAIEQQRTEAREAGVRSARRGVETLSDAELVQRSLSELSSKLVSDEAQPFAPEELGRGRWKWTDRTGSGIATVFVYADERPHAKQVREVGSLLYHLERVDREPGIVWMPYRWDPKRADWKIREFCPPALRAHRELVAQRALVDRHAEALARVDARFRALTPAEAGRAQEKRLLEQTREGYEGVVRRYLELAEQARSFVKAQVALPAVEHGAGAEGAAR